MFHVEFYLCFRYPNLKSVRELVYKRGYGKVGNQRIPLTDNALIEKHLGRFLVILGKSILLLLKLLSLINKFTPGFQILHSATIFLLWQKKKYMYDNFNLKWALTLTY